MRKKKKSKVIKPFDIGAYELFNNRLYRPKIIPNKKKIIKKYNYNKDTDYLFIFLEVHKQSVLITGLSSVWQSACFGSKILKI